MGAKMNESEKEQMKVILCHAIGQWYVEWKPKLIHWETKTHQLGFAKEKLKDKICKAIDVIGETDESKTN